MEILNFITTGLGSCASACSRIQFLPLLIAMFLYLLMQLCRARSWQNILAASFKERVGYKLLAATYLVGAGANSVLPARAGEAIKLFLARREIPSSSYPALGSTLISLTVFDTAIGILVLLFAVHQGVLEQFPLPAVSPLALSVVLLLTVLLALTASRHPLVRRFLSKCYQGIKVLGCPRYYLSKVASWQALGWLLRFGSFSLFLQAFGISGSAENVLLVMGVQGVASIIPFSPGGAGTQQALLVATLGGTSSGAVIFYSIGAQLAITVLSVGLAFIALGLVFQTMDWRKLTRGAKADLHDSLKTPVLESL